MNLEQNRPTVAEALLRLSQELRLAKCGRCRALKVIHGYGSSGQGGKIKPAVQTMLAEKKRAGLVHHFVKGEDFTAFTTEGREALSLCPVLKKDADFGRENDGITIILF